jgi:hypothetical protein
VGDELPVGDERGGTKGRPPESGDDDRIDALLEGWSVQAEALAALDDAVAAEELARAEIARISWAERLRAAGEVELELPDGQPIRGNVEAVLADGIHLCAREPGGREREWIVRLQAVQSLSGLGPRTRAATRIEQRLTVATILRGWADDSEPVQILSRRGALTGRLTRVGLDHVDVAVDLGEGGTSAAGWSPVVRTVPMSAVWAVRQG